MTGRAYKVYVAIAEATPVVHALPAAWQKWTGFTITSGSCMNEFAQLWVVAVSEFATTAVAQLMALFGGRHGQTTGAGRIEVIVKNP